MVTSQETSDWRRRHLCDTDPEKHRGGEAGTKGVWRGCEAIVGGDDETVGGTRDAVGGSIVRGAYGVWVDG